MPVIEDEDTIKLPVVFTESSAKSDEAEVQLLKGMLAAAQEKLRETEDKLQNKESENENLRKIIERLLEVNSNSSWNWS
jgi:molecular chaperone GrpE (heat shock protein)